MKSTLKDGGIRVPMIIQWPGTTTKETLHMIDCYPTMLSAAQPKVTEEPQALIKKNHSRNDIKIVVQDFSPFFVYKLGLKS